MKWTATVVRLLAVAALVLVLLGGLTMTAAAEEGETPAAAEDVTGSGDMDGTEGVEAGPAGNDVAPEPEEGASESPAEEGTTDPSLEQPEPIEDILPEGATDGEGDEAEPTDELGGGPVTDGEPPVEESLQDGETPENVDGEPTGESGSEPEPEPGPDSEPLPPSADATPAAATTDAAEEDFAAQQTGTVVASAEADGAPILHACFHIYRDAGGSLGQFLAHTCDGFNDPVDGSATFLDVPAGNLILLLSSTGPTGEFIAGGQVPFTLDDGETETLTIVTEQGGRTLRIEKVDEAGDPLGGACFNIHRDAGGGQIGDFVTSNCDGPIPNGPFDGVIFISGIVPGNYVAFESRVPSDYARAGNTLITVPTGGTGAVPVTVQNLPLLVGGNLIVNKVDEHQAALGGACFNIFEDAGDGNPGAFVTGGCDFQDGNNDGTTVFTGLNVGNYVLAESHAPDGYIVGGRTPFAIVADAPTVLTIPNVPGGATVTIIKVDEDGDLLPGACFSVNRDDGSGQVTQGSFIEGRCDDSDGANDGAFPFTGLPTGAYILVEFQPPAGYAQAANILFSVDASETDFSLTVENVPTGDEEFGSLVIKKVDQHGNPRHGSCFELIEGTSESGTMVDEQCDGVNDPDGANNGTLSYLNNVRGIFTVRESKAPPGCVATTLVQTTATIEPGETVTLTFVNTCETKRDEPPKDDTPATPETGGVTTLPATGGGPIMPSNGYQSMVLGALSLAVLVGLAHARRRAA